MANNSMQFFGTFDAKLEPNTNSILAFTIGDLTNEGWLSDKAANLDDLITRVKDRHSSKLKLILAVQASAFKGGNFNIDAEGVKQEFFDIRIFLPELQAFKKTIHFFNIERIGKPLPSTKYNSPHKFYTYQFKIGKKLEFT